MLGVLGTVHFNFWCSGIGLAEVSIPHSSGILGRIDVLALGVVLVLEAIA